MTPRGSAADTRVRAVPATATEYIRERFPPETIGVALLTGYALSFALYARASDGEPPWAVTVTGTVAFLLLFLQRRMLDDFEDRESDLAVGAVSEAQRRRYPRALILGICCTSALAIALHATGSWAWLLVGMVATGWTPAANALKRHTRRRGVLFALHESCPAVFMVSAYLLWVLNGDQSRPPVILAVLTVSLFWLLYFYWNFTHKVGRADWPPWWLTPGQGAVVTGLVLALIAVCGMGVGLEANLPWFYLVTTVAIPTAAIVDLVACWRREAPGTGPGRPWAAAGPGRAWAALGGLGLAAVFLMQLMIGVVATWV